MNSKGLTEEFGAFVKSKLAISWRTLHDPLRRSRYRWFFLGWIITIPSLLLGAGFAVAGEKIVLATGAFAIYARVPGGLHTHGVMLLGVGTALLIGLSMPLFGYPEPRRWLRMTLIFTGYYYGWSAAMLAMAPFVSGGAFSYVGVIVWTTLAFLPAVLLVGPPPALVSKDETNILRAAVAVGITSDKAVELVKRLYPDVEHASP